MWVTLTCSHCKHPCAGTVPHCKHTLGILAQRLVGHWVQGCLSCNRSWVSAEKTAEPENTRVTPCEVFPELHSLDLGLRSTK